MPTEIPDIPLTREEQYLAAANGQSHTLPMPLTREEAYLYEIATKMQGGGVTVEPLSVTQNGTYQETGKAFSPVTVDVQDVEIGEPADVTLIDFDGTVLRTYTAASLPDEDALEAVELFPVWAVDTAYPVGIRVCYADKLYHCEQAHTSQAGWEPPVVPALWTEVAEPGTIPVWRQPTGAQDAYMTGDKVRYPDESGDVWISDVDNNVWEPGVYGWHEDVPEEE